MSGPDAAGAPDTRDAPGHVAPETRDAPRHRAPDAPGTAWASRDWALPVLSGLLLVASFPPFTLLVPPFVALVPFLVFIAERPAGPVGRWRALRGGYLLGLVYFGLLLHWVPIALAPFSKLAVPAFALIVLVLAGFTAAFAAALHLVRERTPVSFALAAAVLWTAAEWVQGHLGDLSFPWLGLGTAVAAYPRVAGAADLAGARGLSLWIAAVNGLVASGIVAWRARRPVRRAAAATLVAVALPVAYGAWRVETLEMRPAARVAVVQPNIPEELKMDAAAAVDSTLAALRTLMARIPPGSVDLVVWPEVTFPVALERPEHRRLREAVRAMSARAGAPLLVGAYAVDGVAGGNEADGAGQAGRGIESGPPADVALRNSAFVVAPDGPTGEAYHKRFLVPFVERVPFVDPGWLDGLFGDARRFGGLSPGRGAPTFALGDARYGVLICFESIFARHARALRGAGADFLVNMTNDAWYGRERWYARTSALWQHPAHLAMRAIELRVGIARAANTGFSLFVDPLGRMYERTALLEPDVRVATVYTTDAPTLFARWGDWVGTTAAVAASVLVGMAIGSCGRRRAAPGGRRG